MIFSFALAVDEKMNKNDGYKNVTLCYADTLNWPLRERCQEEPKNLQKLPTYILKLIASALPHPAKSL